MTTMLPARPMDNRSLLLDTNADASHAIRLKRGSCKIGCQTSSTSSSNNLKIMGQPKPQVPRLRSFLSVEKSSTSNLSRFNSKSKMSNSSFSSMAGRNASFQLPNQNSSGMSRNASFGGSHLRLGQNRSCSVPTINDSTPSMNWNGSGVMQMAQRSNGATVKAVIASLKRRCEAAAEEPASSGADTTTDDRKVPIEECSMLKLWSVDAYYKVLISKYGGLVAIVTAMKAFPNEEELQVSCCCSLKHMSNKLAVHQAGGTTALVDAMSNHPQSIQVQSEACEGLKNQAPLLAKEPVDALRKILPLLQHAEQMYLTETGRTSAVFLRNLLSTTLTTAAAQPQQQNDEEVQSQTKDAIPVEVTTSS